MKTLRLNTERDVLLFGNPEGKPKIEIFEEVLNFLREKKLNMGNVEDLLYADKVRGEIKGIEFELISDMDEGTFIHSKDPRGIDLLEEILNDE